MKEIALLGPTASGKSALAIELAQKFNANILSLDSLAIYKDTDIVSAKPTKEERNGIKHFGIDILEIDQYFSAATFFNLYKEAKNQSILENKNLIIVGGTSFYLKSMLQGLSPKVVLSNKSKEKLQKILLDLEDAYNTIEKIDPTYAKKISSQDSYRIEKWFEIYIETKLDATTFFEQNRPTPLIKNIKIFDIQTHRELLSRRIKDRTTQMIKAGLIDEIFKLEKKYTRTPTPMKAIGIQETLDFLDGKLSLTQLHEQISIHTMQLAKRQETFNNSQFQNKTKELASSLINTISKYLN